MSSRSTIIYVGLIFVLSSAPAWSQRLPSSSTSSNHIKDMEGCQAIAVPNARLACFDAAAAALVGAARRGDTTVVDRSEVRQVRRSLFGFSMPKLPFFRGDESAGEVSNVLETRIASVRSLGYGRYRLTLADGDAVWETTESFENMNDPIAGQPIKLKRGALGRYILLINGQRGVSGRRVG
jgi:hypothetical protein